MNLTGTRRPSPNSTRSVVIRGSVTVADVPDLGRLASGLLEGGDGRRDWWQVATVSLAAAVAVLDLEGEAAASGWRYPKIPFAAFVPDLRHQSRLKRDKKPADPFPPVRPPSFREVPLHYGRGDGCPAEVLIFHASPGRRGGREPRRRVSPGALPAQEQPLERCSAVDGTSARRGRASRWSRKFARARTSSQSGWPSSTGTTRSSSSAIICSSLRYLLNRGSSAFPRRPCSVGGATVPALNLQDLCDLLVREVGVVPKKTAKRCFSGSAATATRVALSNSGISVTAGINWPLGTGARTGPGRFC